MEAYTALRQHKPLSRWVKIIAIVLCFLLVFEQSGFAQVAGQLDISGRLNELFSHSFKASFFTPRLRYVFYDQENQNFKIIIDRRTPDKNESSSELLKFFFIGLSLPNSNFWVNLRIDSPDAIIDDYLAQTDLGKIMLEADLQLKKDLARAIFPSTPEGKEYWDKMYQKIKEIYADAQANPEISVNTRIWITPGEVILCEDNNSAYIYKASLNVLTEAAYLSSRRGHDAENEQTKAINDYSSNLMQELVLPKISKEVNTSDKYAALRQAYYSLILAQWFKRKFYGESGLYPYLIDKKNLIGITSETKWSKEKYFEEFRKSYTEKEYDLHIQTFDLFGKTIRTYSIGGIDFTGIFTGTPTKINVISSNSFNPPLPRGAELLTIDTQRATVNNPYSSLFVYPGRTLSSTTQPANFPAESISTSRQSERTLRSPSSVSSSKKRISESEIDKIIEKLRFSSERYIQNLLKNNKIDLRQRIRFVTDELGFDITNGQGYILLASKPESLRTKKEFLDGLGLGITLANLRLSKKSFIARELQQIIKYPQWQQFSDGERLSVLSHLFEVYGSRASWIMRNNDWHELVQIFNLKDGQVNYTPFSIDFIQKYELARFKKFKNFQQTRRRILKIRDVIETMRLEVATVLKSKTTPEGFEVYYVTPQANERNVNASQKNYPLSGSEYLAAPDSYEEEPDAPHSLENLNLNSSQVLLAEEDPSATVESGKTIADTPDNSSNSSGTLVKLAQRLVRAEEDFNRTSKRYYELEAKIAKLGSLVLKRRADIQKISQAVERYLRENRPAYANNAARIKRQMQASLDRLERERDLQKALFVIALQEFSATKARLDKLKRLMPGTLSTPMQDIQSAEINGRESEPASESEGDIKQKVLLPERVSFVLSEPSISSTTAARSGEVPGSEFNHGVTQIPPVKKNEGEQRSIPKPSMQEPFKYSTLLSAEDEKLLIDPKARMKQTYEDWLKNNPKSSTKEKINKIFSIFEAELFVRIGQAIELGQLDSYFISGVVDFVVQLALDTEGSRKYTPAELSLLRQAVEKKFEDFLRDEHALRTKIKFAIRDFDLKDLLENTILAQRKNVCLALEQFLTDKDRQYREKVLELAVIKLKRAWAGYRGLQTEAKALARKQKEFEGALKGIENAVYAEIVKAAPDLKDKSVVSVVSSWQKISSSAAIVTIFASLTAILTGCVTPSQMHGPSLDLAQINSAEGLDYLHPDLILPINNYLPPEELQNPNLSYYFKIVAMGESDKATNIHRLLDIADQHPSSSNFKGLSPGALLKMILPLGKGSINPNLNIEVTQDILKLISDWGTHLLYLYDETDPDIRAAAWWAIGKLKPAVDKQKNAYTLKRLIIKRALKALKDKSASVRIAACWTLAQYRDSYNLVMGADDADIRIDKALLELIDHQQISWLEQYFIISILASSSDPRVTDSIINILNKTDNPCVMAVAVEALSRQKAYGGILPMLKAAGRLQFSLQPGDEPLYIVDSYVLDSIGKGLVAFVQGILGEPQRRQHVLVSFIQALQQLQLDPNIKNKYEIVNSNYAALFQQLARELNIQKSQLEHLLQTMSKHGSGKTVLDPKVSGLLFSLLESKNDNQAEVSRLSDYVRTEKSYLREIEIYRKIKPETAESISLLEQKSQRKSLGRIVVFERSSAEARALAADALSRIGNDGHSRRALLASLSLESDPLARAAILRALSFDAANKTFIYTGPQGDFAQALQRAVLNKDWKTIFT